MNQPEPRPRRILIVEDDPERMGGLMEYLIDEGYEVELTADRALTERLCRERFDLLLVDVMISATAQDGVTPNLHFDGVQWTRTGLEFLKRLRQNQYSGPGSEGTPGHVPVILLSAVADDSAEEDEEIVEMASKYVEKPFRLSSLSEIISDLLENAR